MKRYSQTPIIKNMNNKIIYYSSLKLPNIERTDSDLYIQVKKGDRLDKLSDLYYDTTENWWILAVANGLGKGSIIIPYNMQFRIPQNLPTIGTDLEKINKRKF